MMGMDLGAGSDHRLKQFKESREILVDPDPEVSDLDDPFFDGSFAKFIWKRQVTARNEPFNKDRYLLISAGPYALWRPQDDIPHFQ